MASFLVSQVQDELGVESAFVKVSLNTQNTVHHTVISKSCPERDDLTCMMWLCKVYGRLMMVHHYQYGVIIVVWNYRCNLMIVGAHRHCNVMLVKITFILVSLSTPLKLTCIQLRCAVLKNRERSKPIPASEAIRHITMAPIINFRLYQWKMLGISECREILLTVLRCQSMQTWNRGDLSVCFF